MDGGTLAAEKGSGVRSLMHAWKPIRAAALTVFAVMSLWPATGTKDGRQSGQAIRDERLPKEVCRLGRQEWSRRRGRWWGGTGGTREPTVGRRSSYHCRSIGPRRHTPRASLLALSRARFGKLMPRNAPGQGRSGHARSRSCLSASLRVTSRRSVAPPITRDHTTRRGNCTRIRATVANWPVWRLTSFGYRTPSCHLSQL